MKLRASLQAGYDWPIIGLFCEDSGLLFYQLYFSTGDSQFLVFDTVFNREHSGKVLKNRSSRDISEKSP